MSPSMPAAKRIERAKELIQEARDLPVPQDGGKFNFSYVVQVKAKLKEARELVQLIPKRVGVSDEMKAQVRMIFEQIEQADRDLFH